MRPVFLLPFVSLAVAVACSPTTPAFSDADKAAIRAATDSFVASARSRKDSGSAGWYTETAVFMPPNQGAVEGRAAIRAWFENFPPMSEFTLTPIEIDGNGDLAYVRGNYTLTITGPTGQPAMSDHGKFLEVRRRQADGRWLMVTDIFNSDVPVAPAPAPRRR